MARDASDEKVDEWRRRFAADANNRAWSLSEKRTLTSEERSELLHAAHAAAHHWTEIGTEVQVARAELLLGRTHALLGHGGLAMQFATSAFNSITSRRSEPWEVAFAHAVLANAAAVSGHAELHALHYGQARVVRESLTEADKAIFQKTFDLIPMP